MNEIIVNSEIVEKDYPKLYDMFLDELRRSESPNSKVEFKNIKWLYYWTFDMGKKDDINEAEKHTYKFEKRLDYELSTVIMEIYMKAGTYVRGDEPPYISQYIIDNFVKNVVITSMVLEQKFYKNQEVIDSLPDGHTEITKQIFEENPQLETLIKEGGDFSPEDFDLNEILDKISDKGYDSLSEAEKQYLNNMSEED